MIRSAPQISTAKLWLEGREVARPHGLLAGHDRLRRNARNQRRFDSQGPITVTTNTVGVESVDAAVTAVQSTGGKVVVPKMAIPTIGYLAYCQDPEGNVFGWMQAEANAK
jgi:predicted lactoylglutathione lyase